MYIHGGKGTRLYRTWQNMRQRCNNPHNGRYASYGGRGIYIYEEWNDFSKFRDWAHSTGYRDDLTIDRIDNDGPYTPANCRWTTYKVQVRNRRVQKNSGTGVRGVWKRDSGKYRVVFYTAKGKRKCLGEYDTIEEAEAVYKQFESEFVNGIQTA